MKLNSAISAVVTGGASGMGEAVSIRLASHGVRVAIFDLNEERGAALAKQIGGVFCRVNVTSDDEVAAGFERARIAHGQERILINCAGVGGGAARTASMDRKTGIPREYPLSNFYRIIEVNLVGTFRCITKSAAGMLTLDPLESGERGAIVNTASIAAQDGQIGQVAYAASKAGVVGMTLPIARDLGDAGIRVNTILPGVFETPMMAPAPQAMIDNLLATTPFPRRPGKADEFAQLAETMITCGYLNAEHVRLDGGTRFQPR
ncbi:3-hydroxy-2-methylbutyryl-CoA dehydrogenase [Sphingomonas panacis]|uniref:3-hydroxy-2-methylbutyryl-CoA dehydrogenase n=1 Tax=Sphingomonas panacis TaxID=1560345 RepID=A0A1B3Z793_9SPHN|nr:SDR family NAD(P)-dependent oxidoreductase [Sphingomonas panacis]AOH83280.1 3-hydroxy-2-methylbutyryl-CoA dehydrogenase [Sphingomonas panacis]